MAANKRKILETARKYAQKGAKDKALAEYQKLVKLDPRDTKLKLEIGDTYRRWGQVDQAIDTYGRVAEQYMKEGFDARAVAVWKQILNLDPDRYSAYEPLAELYERMGLTAEAINSLQMAADGHHRAGRKREALDVLRKMSTIDPSNTTSRIKVAELLRQEEMTEEAVLEYEQVAEELERQGDLEAVGNIYRRVLEIEPTRASATEKLARNLLAQGKPAEAEALAKRVLDADADEPGHYELLADVYHAQGREDLMGRVYRSLAEVFRKRGDEERARDLLQRFVPPDQLVGDDRAGGDGAGVGDAEPEFGSLGDDLVPEDALSSMGGQPMIPRSDELELGPELEVGREAAGEDDLDDALDLDEPVASAPPEKPAPAARRAPAAPGGDPDQLLAEASVYLRYGKREKAIAHLEAILAAAPGHRVALDKLGEAYAEGGDTERAVETWRQAAERAQEEGDAEALKVLRGRIASLDPAAAGELGGGEAPADAAADDVGGIELDLDGAEDELVLDDDPRDAAAEISDTGDDGGFDFDLDAEDEPGADLGVDAAPDAAEASDEPEMDIEIDVEDEPAPQPAAARSAPARSDSDASLSSTTAQQVMEDLEEADFYMEQGLHNEAEEIYQRVLAVAPNHPRALLRLGEVEAARGEEPGTTGTDLRTPAKPAASRAPEARQEAAPPAPSEPEEEIDVDVDVDVEEDAEALFEESGADVSLDLGTDLDDDTEDPVDAGAARAAPEESAARADDAPSDDDTGELSIPTESLVPEPAAAAPGEGFDLAAELSDVFDGDANEASGAGTGTGDDDGFAAVFEAFKRGVSETLSEADHEAHYDLGIAYKEMGLLDDAIQEFRAAMVHPPRVVECLHLIALCALDAERHDMAAEHLEQLLEMPNVTPAQQLASRYELGRAYQALSRNGEAKLAFEQVLAVDAGYLDAAERLKKVASPDPEAGSGGSPESEGFESFDDILADVDADEAPEARDEAGESFEDLMAEVGDDATPVAGATAPQAAPAVPEPEPEPEPEPDPTPRPAPGPSGGGRGKKKKKISFL